MTAFTVCRQGSRCWQRWLSWPGFAPQPLQHHSPLQIPGVPTARGLASTATAIRFSPATRSLFDEPLGITVHGLSPRQQVTLRASLQDEAGELFEARARYQAAEDGELDLARCPALPGGSFSGLEPMGLLWALQPRKAFWRLVKKDVQTPFRLQLEVLEGHGDGPGRLLAQAQHERAFLRDGVRRVPVREGRIRATLFLPPGEYRHGPVRTPRCRLLWRCPPREAPRRGDRRSTELGLASQLSPVGATNFHLLARLLLVYLSYEVALLKS